MLIAICTLFGCSDPYQKGDSYNDADEVAIATWIEAQPNFTQWTKALKRTNLYNAINISIDEFTCFVVADENIPTFIAKYNEENECDYSSLEDIPTDELTELMRYHIIPRTSLRVASMDLKLPYPTASGDYLTSVVDTATDSRSISNGIGRPNSNFVKGDIELINGLVHHIDHVLMPIATTIWDILQRDDKYSIFAAAVEESGMDEILDQKNATIGDFEIDTEWTLLVVTDEMFAENYITSIDDLKAKYSGDPADTNSDFNRWVRYQMLEGLYGYSDIASFEAEQSFIEHYPSDPYRENAKLCYTMLENKAIAILDRSNVLILNPDDEVGGAATFIREFRDIPASNGYIHEISKPLDVPFLMQTQYPYVFEPTAKKEFKILSYYRSKKTVSDPEEEYRFAPDFEIPGIRFKATPADVGYISYWNGQVDEDEDQIDRFLYDDILLFNLGSIGWIEFDIPALPLGKYNVYMEKWSRIGGGISGSNEWNGVANIGGLANFHTGADVVKCGTGVEIKAEMPNTFRINQGTTLGVGGVDKLYFIPVL